MDWQALINYAPIIATFISLYLVWKKDDRSAKQNLQSDLEKAYARVTAERNDWQIRAEKAESKIELLEQIILEMKGMAHG